MAEVSPLLAHLLRRAGFGASPDELTAYGALSFRQAIDKLVNYQTIPDTVDANISGAGFVGTTSNGPFSPNTVITDARQRWLFRMLHSPRPLQEKMTLFWHNYFATGYSKVAGVVQAVNATRLMAAKASEDPQHQQGQIELLRANATGNFRQLLLAIAQDPAMLIWLDGNTNTKAAPQENFGRELMELFSRGVGFYTESDVYAAARVFTGWNLQVSGGATNTSSSFSFAYRAAQHDTNAKTFSFPIYKDGGATIPARAATSGMQDGVDLITALASHPETARRLATRLYSFFVSETNAPDPRYIDTVASVYLAADTEIAPVIMFLLSSAPFLTTSNFFTRYAWPAEFVVRAMKETGWNGFSLGSTLSPLINMGQELFEPPDVAGWPLGTGWFSSGAMLARMNFASALASNQKFKLASSVASARSSPSGLLALVLGRFSAPFDGATPAELAAFMSSGAWTGSDAQLQTKASGLAHLIVGSPEYQFV